MKLTLRQRKVLRILGSVSPLFGSEPQIKEYLLHAALKLSSTNYKYQFFPKCWRDVDKRFPDKRLVFSEELHLEIEDMVRKGYVIRGADEPLFLRAREPEVLYGEWFNENNANNFEMGILGKRQNENSEEIGGEIIDCCGVASFWGCRSRDKITFTKVYDEGYLPFAVRGEIFYQGKKQGKIYQGVYNFMELGEILREGEFVLAKRIKDLSGYLPRISDT